MRFIAPSTVQFKKKSKSKILSENSSSLAVKKLGVTLRPKTTKIRRTGRKPTINKLATFLKCHFDFQRWCEECRKN
jgi:hypothetical protein